MTERDAPSKGRMPLRGAVIAAGYVLYLIVDSSQAVFPSALIGLGFALYGLAEVDSRTLATKDRSRMMEVGFKILGLGLLGLGLYLVLR